jgi:hypothetical protein
MNDQPIIIICVDGSDEVIDAIDYRCEIKLIVTVCFVIISVVLLASFRIFS